MGVSKIILSPAKVDELSTPSRTISSKPSFSIPNSFELASLEFASVPSNTITGNSNLEVSDMSLSLSSPLVVPSNNITPPLFSIISMSSDIILEFSCCTSMNAPSSKKISSLDGTVTSALSPSSDNKIF